LAIFYGLGAFFYQKYLADSEYKVLFLIGLITDCFRSILFVIQGLRLNASLGYKFDIMMYLFSGAFIGLVERIL
jgi:hypothetical protein